MKKFTALILAILVLSVTSCAYTADSETVPAGTIVDSDTTRADNAAEEANDTLLNAANPSPSDNTETTTLKPPSNLTEYYSDGDTIYSLSPSGGMYSSYKEYLANYYTSPDIPDYVEYEKEYLDDYLYKDPVNTGTYGDFEYGIQSDGTCVIERYNGLSSKVTVPSEINGHTVRGIGSSAFANKFLLKSVTIPDTVEVLGDGVFSNCILLTDVVLPDSIMVTEGWIFSGCRSLKSVRLPKHLKVLMGATFYKCTSLESVEGDLDEVYMIDTFVFYQCISLKEFKIPQNVIKICDDAFAQCVSLKKVVFNDKLSIIEESAFDGCISLEITELPDSIKGIYRYAFGNCYGTKNIDCPDNILFLDEAVFYEIEDQINLVVSEGSETEAYAKKYGISYTLK
ncbi:MAG: leucine-rich repeat domain-containing protein [Clostridiales bacterium]|nr:leucine-rich repeat domain-containing protein [Clostridiales bacterium]